MQSRGKVIITIILMNELLLQGKFLFNFLSKLPIENTKNHITYMNVMLRALSALPSLHHNIYDTLLLKLLSFSLLKLNVVIFYKAIFILQ